jgi:hypothetical protein
MDLGAEIPRHLDGPVEDFSLLNPARKYAL